MCSLLLFLMPGASAACPGTIYTGPIPTAYYEPGPHGTIYVETSPPGAVVYVNGENKGHAPATVTGLWPGSYTVTAELAGYEEFTTATTISGPTRSSVYCSLVPDSSGTGLYVISTPPDASVYLDGDLRGKTPLMLRDTTPGPHNVLLRLSGYADWKSSVQAPSGGTKTVSATMEQTDTDVNQGLNITSSPSGAKVILDGLEKGVTPISLHGVAPGIHILEIGYTGHTSWKSTVDVPETDIKEVRVNLKPEPSSAPGWIAVSSDPGDASVTLDGLYVGRTPANGTLGLDGITPGEHTVILALPGYRSYSLKTTVSPGQVFTVNATLEPVSGPLAKGALAVSSDPPGATIIVDNAPVGTSPLTVNDVAVGNHEVTVRMEGYQDYSASLLVSAGTTRAVSTTLLPVTPSVHSPVLPLTVLAALIITGFFTLRKKE